MTVCELRITSLGGLGDGIATHHVLPVFVEKAAVGDVLSVRLTQQTREHARAEILEILSPGPQRVAPPCPHFSRCGGCSLQQLSENAYRTHKRKVLADALAHAGFGEVQAEIVFLPMASRRRVELKWDGQHFAYYASRSRALVPIAQCLILEPALQALLPPLAEALRSWPAQAGIKTIRLTAADSGTEMLIEHSETATPPTAHSDLAERARPLGIDRIILNGKTILEHAPITMRLGDVDVPLPPGAFLQATREGAQLLTQAVVRAILPPPLGGRSGGGQTCSDSANHAPLPASPLKGEEFNIADLFCGLGTYSFALARQARVHAVELDAGMSQALKRQAQAQGLSELTSETRDLFTAPLRAAELARFDAVVLNPPRPGAKAQCEEIAKSSVKKAVMVSCSPASFARDAKILKNAGFSLLSAQGIDQFVMSPHLEIVAAFTRV